MWPTAEKFGKKLQIYAFDFAPKAVELLRTHELYKSSEGGIVAEVCDLVKDKMPEEFSNVDFLTCIFVLSAISPEHHIEVVSKLYDAMRSDSYMYFRDYGRYDLA
jgi:tRNAThr (cytosine32-N3)-methyltransferase